MRINNIFSIKLYDYCLCIYRISYIIHITTKHLATHYDGNNSVHFFNYYSRNLFYYFLLTTECFIIFCIRIRIIIRIFPQIIKNTQRKILKLLKCDSLISLNCLSIKAYACSFDNFVLAKICQFFHIFSAFFGFCNKYSNFSIKSLKSFFTGI